MAEKKKKSLVKRIFKWFGIILLLLIIAIITIPFLFKDKIIQAAVAEAEKSLNAKLHIGDVDLTVFRSFPDVSVTVSDMSVANIEPFEGDTLISAPTFRADINLMSLFGDKYEINKIYLDHPRIHALVLADGKANWDITKPSAEEAAPGGEASSFKMSLEEFKIDKGYIVYDDASLGMKTVVRDMDHTLSGDFTEDIFDIKTITDIRELTVQYGGVPYLNKVNTKLEAEINADMPNFKFTMKDNKIVLNELELGVDGWWAMPKEDMNMDLKFNARETEFKNILSLVPGAYTKDFEQVKTAGKLTLNGFAKGTYNEKQMPAFGAKILVQDAMFQYPGLPRSANDILIDATVDNPTGVPDATVIDIKKFHVELGGNPVDMTMLVKTPVSDPALNGAILGKVNLGTLKDVIPLEQGDELTGMVTADVKMNGRMSSIEKERYEEFNANGQVSVLDMRYTTRDMPEPVNISTMYLNFSPQFVELSKFDANIGKSDISAKGKIENFIQYAFKDELLKGNFTMSSNVFDLRDFMAEEETPAQPAQQPAEAGELTVVEVPGNIQFDMGTTIGKLVYDKNLTLTDVAGAVTVKDKRIDLSNLKMKALGGAMAISGYYDTKNLRKPQVDMKLNISDMDIVEVVKFSETVRKLAPVAEYAKGKFSTVMEFSSILDSKMEPVLNTLSGYGKLTTRQVTLSGFTPLVKLGDILKTDKFSNYVMENLNLSFSFKDGRVVVEPFDFKAGGMAGKVGGSNGFDQTIDYVMTLEIPRNALGASFNNAVSSVLGKTGGAVNVGDKLDLSIFFKGTVKDPKVETNLKDMAKDVMEDIKTQVKDTIQKTINQAKEDVSARVEAEKKKILDEAEKKAQQVRAAAAAQAENIRKEGEAAAKKIEAEAKNPLEKVAKKKLADETRKKSNQTADNIVKEADKKANDIIEEARKRADAVK